MIDFNYLNYPSAICLQNLIGYRGIKKKRE